MINTSNEELFFLVMVKLILLMYFWKYQTDMDISRICKISRKVQVGLSKQDKRSEAYVVWKDWATWTFLMLTNCLHRNQSTTLSQPRKSWTHESSLWSLSLPTALQTSTSPFHWWPCAAGKSDKFQPLAMPANCHCLRNSYCHQYLMKLFLDWI